MENKRNPQTITVFEGFFIIKNIISFYILARFYKFWTVLLLSLILCCFVLPGSSSAEDLFVVTTDYETGGLAQLNTKALYADHSEGIIYSDSVARSFEDSIYIIERWHADNILVLRANNPSIPVIQFSVGNGNNPHDLLLINPDKAYVTLYEQGYLLIVNPKTGKTTGQIDLSGFSDSDGIPEMDLMVRVEDRVFVSLQRLDRSSMFHPATFGQVAVIDCKNDSIIDADPERSGVQAIDLSLGNPYDMQVVPGTDRILVAEAGSFYNQDDGGFEFIDTAAYRAEGVAMTESDLGGQIGGASGAFSMTSQDEGYAIIMNSSWQTSVVRFNLSTRSVVPVHVPDAGFVHAGVLVSDKRLFVCDRTMDDPGIRVFNTDNNREITGAPVDTGLPPFCLVKVDTSADEQLPQGGDNQTSTPPDPVECPVEFLFGERHPVTVKCRIFRDKVLSRFKVGRSVIRIYYAYSPEITRLLKSDRSLRMKVSLLIKLFFSETAEAADIQSNAVFLEIIKGLKNEAGVELISEFKRVLNLIFFNTDDQTQKH